MQQTVWLTPQDTTPEPEAALAHGGVPVVLSLSAYDIPNSFTIEPESGLLKITFNYMDREEAVSSRVDDDFTVLTGQSSGKVLGFILKPDARKARDITVRIVQGVEQQIQRATRPNQRLNYKLIKRVMSSKLEPALAGA